MFRFDEGLKVYLHREPVDFRLNINGLAVLVEQALGLDPFASCAYVFSNRRRDRVKILGWERNGFWLLLKRLEKDRFIWPSADAVPTLRPNSCTGCWRASTSRWCNATLVYAIPAWPEGTMMAHADPSGRVVARHNHR